MRAHSLVAAAAILLTVGAPAAAEPAAVDPAVTMKSGRELFERSCKLCHSLDRSLAVTWDAPAWQQIVKRMIAYGTPLNIEQRPLVVRYLAARSVFADSCGGCHELTHVVKDEPGVRDWTTLTGHMAGHVRELEKQGKAPAGAALTPEELADIAALLQVVTP